jgi:sirohydrochlorin ferrochelatase
MHDIAPRLLVVAHGTASPAGSATTAALIDRIALARPDVRVDLCFLDVAAPRLPDVLGDAPTVVVPMLLSTGYHVRSDIPSAAAPYPNVHVARHLGPHPLLLDALVDRLGSGSAASTVLVGAGSTRAEAAAELAETGRRLGERLGSEVAVLTITDGLRADLSALAGPLRIATYLLAEGQFLASLRAAADGLGRVAEPLGVHPALVELVWARYDDARS